MQMFLLLLTFGMVTTVAALLARDVPAASVVRPRAVGAKVRR